MTPKERVIRAKEKISHEVLTGHAGESAEETEKFKVFWVEAFAGEIREAVEEETGRCAGIAKSRRLMGEPSQTEYGKIWDVGYKEACRLIENDIRRTKNKNR